MRPALIVPAAVLCGVLALTACGSTAPGYYVGTDGTTVARIEWSAPLSGRASGTITDDTLIGTAPTGSVDAQTVAVAVTFRGSTVTFTGAGLDALAGAPLTGTLSGGTLSIRAPGASGYLDSAVLRAGTAVVYNTDLATLKQRARHDNEVVARRTARQEAAAEIAGDQQAVSDDETSLAASVSQLSADVAQMGTDTQQGNTDLQTLDSDAASGCTNAAAVTQDDYTVNTDGSTVGSDAMTITTDISTVQTAVGQLQTDDEAVLKAGGVPQGDPAGAISQAQTAISNAVSQANADIADMNGYMSQAYSTASNLADSSCAGSGD